MNSVRGEKRKGRKEERMRGRINRERSMERKEEGRQGGGVKRGRGDERTGVRGKERKG